MHGCCFIVRSANIVIVVAIGTAGLLLGWFLEFSVHRAIHCPLRFDLNMPERYTFTIFSVNNAFSTIFANSFCMSWLSVAHCL